MPHMTQNTCNSSRFINSLQAMIDQSAKTEVLTNHNVLSKKMNKRNQFDFECKQTYSAIWAACKLHQCCRNPASSEMMFHLCSSKWDANKTSACWHKSIWSSFCKIVLRDKSQHFMSYSQTRIEQYARTEALANPNGQHGARSKHRTLNDIRSSTSMLEICKLLIFCNRILKIAWC